VLDFIGGRGRNRTYNLSPKSGIARPRRPMISKEYRGARRTIWNHFGTQFGEEFGKVLPLKRISGRKAFSAPDPSASGNLVVDKTAVCLTMRF